MRIDRFLYDWTRERGFSEGYIGTAMLREAAEYVAWCADPWPAITKEVYPHVGNVYGRDADCAERSIRAAIARSALAGTQNGIVIRTFAKELQLSGIDPDMPHGPDYDDMEGSL